MRQPCGCVGRKFSLTLAYSMAESDSESDFDSDFVMTSFTLGTKEFN